MKREKDWKERLEECRKYAKEGLEKKQNGEEDKKLEKERRVFEEMLGVSASKKKTISQDSVVLDPRKMVEMSKVSREELKEPSSSIAREVIENKRKRNEEERKENDKDPNQVFKLE